MATVVHERGGHHGNVLYHRSWIMKRGKTGYKEWEEKWKWFTGRKADVMLGSILNICFYL